MLTNKRTYFASVAILIASLQGLPQTGGTFRIDQKVISAGAQPAAGGSLAVQNTSGQPVAGPISGGTFTIQAGFWNATAFPTAAGVSISGRILSPTGRSVARATLELRDSSGTVRSARVNIAGRFVIDDVPAGETYVLTVKHRTYRFAPQVLTVVDTLADIEIRAIN